MAWFQPALRRRIYVGSMSTDSASSPSRKEKREARAAKAAAELEALEKVTEKIGTISVYGGLDGVLNELVRIKR